MKLATQTQELCKCSTVNYAFVLQYLASISQETISKPFFASAKMLRIVPFILANSFFSCMIAIFLKWNLWKLRYFSPS